MTARRLMRVAAGGAIVAVGAALVAGHFRWRAETRALRERLAEARRPVVPDRVDFGELDGLPAPVQRYFRTVLADGQPMIAAVDLRHSGTFNMGETDDQWRTFSSDQRVTTEPPGFDWHARIAMAPVLDVRVHDAYIAGEGILHASLFGLVPVARMSDTDELARGELLRYLAETAWYPTALLPSQGVQWTAIDDRSARVVLADVGLEVAMVVRFGGDGLIASVEAERGRAVGEAVEPTPWQGRFWNYAQRSGVLVPLDGEVAWQLPNGPRPYWRGHLEAITYEWVR